MDARVADPHNNAESSIGDLFGQLADDSRNLIRAEANLYKKIAIHRAGKATGGAIALVVGALLLNAALIVLLVGAALALALHLGPLLGALIVAAASVIGGALLIRFGMGKLKALSGDAEEKAALNAGERLP